MQRKPLTIRQIQAATARGRKMVKARWEKDRKRRYAETLARLERWAEFEITVRHRPTGESATVRYCPDIGLRLAVLVENLAPVM